MDHNISVEDEPDVNIPLTSGCIPENGPGNVRTNGGAPENGPGNVKTNGSPPESGSGNVKTNGGPPENVSGNVKMNGGPPENGPGNSPETKRLVSLDVEEQDGFQISYFSLTIIGTLGILLLVSLAALFALLVSKKELQANLGPSDGCSHGWHTHGNYCYLYPNEEHSWNFSRDNCLSYGASLVTPASEEERALVKSEKDAFWIDLQRDSVEHLWTWPNGSHVTQFEVKGGGNCAYVSADGVSSTNCDNTRRRMCKKSVQAA